MVVEVVHELRDQGEPEKEEDVVCDIIKHVFKTNINSECGVPPAPGGYEIKFLTLLGVCPNTV